MTNASRPSTPSRRDFLAISAGGAAASILPQATAAGQEASAESNVGGESPEGSDAVRVAVVGVRGRGWNHTDAFARQPGVEVVALCDVDSAVLARRAAECAAGSKNRRPFEVETTGDMRTLLDRDDIDAKFQAWLAG